MGTWMSVRAGISKIQKNNHLFKISSVCLPADKRSFFGGSFSKLGYPSFEGQMAFQKNSLHFLGSPHEKLKRLRDTRKTAFALNIANI